MEAELLGETTEKNEEKDEQLQSGGSSPTSPAFEVETAPESQPVDPKEVLTELGTCIKYGAYNICSQTCVHSTVSYCIDIFFTLVISRRIRK